MLYKISVITAAFCDKGRKSPREEVTVVAISFHAEDATSCFGSHCDRQPEFRLITLEGEGKDAEGNAVESGVGIALLCRECAIAEVEDELEVIGEKAHSDIPMLGLLLLPLQLTADQVHQLNAEITQSAPINRKSVH